MNQKLGKRKLTVLLEKESVRRRELAKMLKEAKRLCFETDHPRNPLRTLLVIDEATIEYWADHDVISCRCGERITFLL